MLGLLAMSIMAGACAGLPGWRPSSADVRHDPNRPKTPEDMERMAAAQKKRDRKAARKCTQNAATHAPGANEKPLK